MTKTNENKSDATTQTFTGTIGVTPINKTPFNDSGIEHLLELDTPSCAGALRNLAGALQYSMISTADYMLYLEASKTDENIQSVDGYNELLEAEGTVEGEVQETTPKERLLLASKLYWGIAQWFKENNIGERERPSGIADTIQDYTPRMISTNNELFEALEMVPGETARARADAHDKQVVALNKRKPDITKLIVDAKRSVTPDIHAFTELPLFQQLRYMCTAYKSLYYARKFKLEYAAGYNKPELAGEIKTMQADLEGIETWCLQFEHMHADYFEQLLNTNIVVTTIDDAKADLEAKRVKRDAEKAARRLAGNR